MIEKFDAFISYKHAPLDNKIAEEVQKNLEHYHVPSKLKNKLEKKKIERIFRDKAELPITSSLSENISYALEHSDFLIVICSHSTKLSGWVPREIEYFLKFHPISHVLTVLAEGEPDEVIPKQLLETTILKKDEFGETVLDENGEPETEVLELEPLSCDYRLPLRTARRKELPRLAAAILGCSYDELVMRARQYRRRRNAIIISAALIAAVISIGYLLWSRTQIQNNYEQAQENLRQAQINQSIFLANAAERVLQEEHDGIGAAQLALEALPKEGEDRPVLPKALRVLADTVSAYIPEIPSSQDFFPTSKFSMSSPIKSMVTSKDEKTLFLLNESGEVAGFDIGTQKNLFFHSFTSGIWERMSITPVENDRLLISDGFSLHLYNWTTETEIWNLPLFLDDNGNDLFQLTMNSTKLQRLENWGMPLDDPYPPVAMSISPDGTILALDGGNDVIRFIDMKSGSETDTIRAGVSQLEQLMEELKSLDNYDELSEEYHSKYIQNEIQKLIWSPDGKHLAAVYLDGISDDFTVSVLEYDFEDETWSKFDTEATNWEDLCFVGNDALVLLVIGGIDELLSGEMTNRIGNTTQYMESTAQVICYSLETNDILWQSELIWDSLWEVPGNVTYLDTETFGKEAVFACIENSAYILDKKDGEILNSKTYKSTVLSDILTIDKSYTSFYLSNGNTSFLYDEDIAEHMRHYFEVSHFKDTGTPISIEQAIIADDRLLVLQKDCSYILGFSGQYDEDGTYLTGKTFPEKPETTYLVEKDLMVFEEDSFSVLDVETGNLRFEKEIPKSQIKHIFPTNEDGTGTDQCALLLQYDDEYHCLLMDVNDGTTEELPIKDEILACQNGYFFWPGNSEDGSSFGSFKRYSIKDRVLEDIPIHGPEGESISDYTLFQVAKDGRNILCRRADDTFDDNNHVYLIKMDTGDFLTIPNDSGHINSHLIADNQYFAVESNTVIKIYTLEGEEISRINTQGKSVVNMNFAEDRLYVFYNNGKFCRYRISDGAEEDVVNDSFFLDSEMSTSAIYRDGKLFLLTDKNSVYLGGTMTTFDLDQMGIISQIENCCGYSIGCKKYIVWNQDKESGDYVFVTYPVYSVNELVQKGKLLIGESEMTPETKAEYGLD